MPLKKDLGQWVTHFKNSDAPQFKGKSEEERKNMALAAFRKKYGSLNEATDYMKRRKAQDNYATSKKDKPKKSTNPKHSGTTDYMKRRQKDLDEAVQGDVVDTITMDIPLFLRMLEYSREDAAEDIDLHDVTEKANILTKQKGTLTMDDYNEIVSSADEIDEEVITDDPKKAQDIADKTGEPVKLVKKGSLTTLNEGQHYDYEGKMAHSQLLSIVKNARDLFNMINSDTQLKSWVQSKLTKAEDYLDSVRTYLEGESISTTVPAMFENERIKDDEGSSLNIGDVVKGGDGRIYQIIYSASEGKPSLVPFDLKKRKIITLRDKTYFDSDSSIPRKLNRVMDYTATKGGFMN
jgi:hypothetical protein